MIHGIGTDIIEIERITGSIERHGSHFLDRLFTTEEQEYALRFQESARTFAGRFAGKEAVAKALGTGIGEEVSWKDIKILNDTRGKPIVILAAHLMERFGHPEILLSISHCKQYATAFCVIWKIRQ